jgi:hypothetical protein
LGITKLSLPKDLSTIQDTPAVHAAHPAPVERLQEVRSDAALESRPVAVSRASERGPTCLSLAVLLLACSLSLVDGLFGNVVAFERDTSDFYYPLMAWVGQQLHQGVLPLWAPQIFGGYPIFADGEIGLAYPPVLLALLVLPADRALIVLRLAHLCLASAGCYALARTWGLTHAASTLAGLTFALGSFVQAQTHHENIVRTAAWLPIVLALIERALRREGGARLRWTGASALALGMAGLALHSQVLAIELLTLAGYAVFRWRVGPIRGPLSGTRARLRGVLTVFVPVVVLGLGIAAVQLLALAELAGFSPRGGGIPYADAAAYSLTPLGLTQLVFPFVFRTDANQQWGLWTHWESYLYVGLAPLVLAIVALVRTGRREVVGWAIIGLVGLMLALGQYSPLNLHYWLWLLPGMSGLRAPGRFTLVVVLAAAMLAAHGLSRLQRRRPRRATVRLMVVLCGAPVVLAGALLGVHAIVLAQPEVTANLIDRLYLAEPHDVLPLAISDVYDGLLWSTELTNPRTLGALLGMLAVSAALMVWQSRDGDQPGEPGGAAARGGPADARDADGPGPLGRGPGAPGPGEPPRAGEPGAGRCVAGSVVWPGLLVAASLVDLLVFSWSVHPRESLAALGAQPAAFRALPSPDDGQPFRVLASPVLTQVASDRLAPWGLQDANGYSSLESGWHRDYLGRVLRIDDQVLDVWNVRYILDPARFGTLPVYKDVQFLPQQPMLQGATGSSLSDQTFRLDAPTNAVEVRMVLSLVDSVEVPQGARVGEVILRGPDGGVVAQHWLEAGQDVMDWGWDHPSIKPYVRHARVEVAGVAQEGGRPPNQRLLSFAHVDEPKRASVETVEVRATPPHGELAVYGLAVIDANGTAHQLFGRHNAKYTSVYRDSEIAVFENSAAFPRAFVVSGSRLASGGTPLDEMEHGPFHPEREVILARGDVPASLLGQLPSPSDDAESSQLGSAQVEEYGPSRVRVQASTPRDGLLVLTDNVYPGWRAFVDGQEQPIVRGDLLFRVVPLPAGQHEVEFRFEPLSIRLGLLATLASLVLALGLVVAGWRRNGG